MPKLPPPMRPLAVSISLDHLKIVLPVAAIAVLALALTPGLALLLTPRAPMHLPAPPESAPAWTVGLSPSALSALAQEALMALPAPIPGQRVPPNCDPDLERELKGACWVPLAVDRCPPGKAYVNDEGPRADGKCYARGMRAERTPTSGQPRHADVAGP